MSNNLRTGHRDVGPQSSISLSFTGSPLGSGLHMSEYPPLGSSGSQSPSCTCRGRYRFLRGGPTPAQTATCLHTVRTYTMHMHTYMYM